MAIQGTKLEAHWRQTAKTVRLANTLAVPQNSILDITLFNALTQERQPCAVTARVDFRLLDTLIPAAIALKGGIQHLEWHVRDGKKYSSRIVLLEYNNHVGFGTAFIAGEEMIIGSILAAGMGLIEAKVNL